MTTDPSRWLDEHGDVLYRFALGRLRSKEQAEDAVQECLVGALRNAQSFQGRAEERTWLIGILRNKISDQLRRAGRSKEDVSIEFFSDRGHWVAAPGEWHDPEASLESQEFQSRFAECMERLPEPLAEAFLLRESEGLEPQNVCDALGISATNLSTRLYRARLLLRQCLETNWFAHQ